ncbi:MAG TPA: alpha/beta hydrolase [Bacillales bacterium]|nr:alpha/beta hydrolase [Bacillales bacterium]
MKHIFQQGQNDRTLLLLHGTGGTEQDLLPVAEMIDSQASVLSVRGNVSENGMPRFFRRLAEGVFDEEDLVFRTRELHEFLGEAANEHGFNRDQLVAVGYSNGANIAGSLLFHYENTLAGAALLHPMVPRRGVKLPDLSGVPVLISAGRNDPICPPEETTELAETLREASADVALEWQEFGHQLTRSELEKAVSWYQQKFV